MDYCGYDVWVEIFHRYLQRFRDECTIETFKNTRKQWRICTILFLGRGGLFFLFFFQLNILILTTFPVSDIVIGSCTFFFLGNVLNPLSPPYLCHCLKINIFSLTQHRYFFRQFQTDVFLYKIRLKSEISTKITSLRCSGV